MAEENLKPVHQSIDGLEAVLRTKMGDDFILENYTATEFLPPGENYGSLILNVDVLFKRKEKDSKIEELHMIAKTPPLGKWQRNLFDSPNSFKKEIFMYECILPAYKKIDHKCGINKDDIFDIGPAYYGSRLNLDFGHDFDDDAIILLENLKPRGYYIGNRHTGLDLDHLKIVVKAVARFHALGIAIKTKNPEFFEVLKIRSKNISSKDPEGISDIRESIHRTMKEDPIMGKYYHYCKIAMDCSEFCAVTTDSPDDPWSTIIHNDLWINNILFHRNEESGLIDGVKFVDFQNYLIQSPLRDLCYLLGLLSNEEVATKYIPELIDLYHNTFLYRLEIMGCIVTPYTRDKFDEQLSVDALLEFSHIVFMMKYSTRIPDPNSPKLQAPIKDMAGPRSENYYARMRALVNGYAQRGWFQGILKTI